MVRNALYSFILFTLVFSSLALSQAPTKRVLITQPVDDQKRVTLYGNTRSDTTVAADQGRVAESLPLEHMLLLLRRPPELSKALDQYLTEIQDRKSPNYHHWLTGTQFGQEFGLGQDDIDKVTNWLESQGFTVNRVYPNKLTVDFSGNAGEVHRAFRTEIHKLDLNGERHIANMSDPQIPAALAPAIVGLVSLHDFMPRPNKTETVNYTLGTTQQAVVPADLATIYNLNPLFAGGITGQGQTIVVIEDTDVYSTADWTAFRNTFGLSSYASASFSQTHPGNCTDPGVIAGDDEEAILDAEWASASAPNAAIQLASCSNTATTFGGMIALQNLLNSSSTPPSLVSISYGECEASNGAAANAAYAAAFQQAVAEGVSVFVSSGDQGAAGCDGGTYATHGIGVNAFASTPYNVAVGGTDFGDTYKGTNSTYWNTSNTTTFGSAKSYIPEIPWDDSCANDILASYLGYSLSWGSSGFCNSSTGKANYLKITAGSGGPSACASGSPSASGVVGGSCTGYPKPSWQAGVFGNPNDGVRDLPDVSLFAANGLWGHYYVFCFSDTANGGRSCSGPPDTWPGAGGTSFSAPIMAGIQALVNQSTGSRWGNPNSKYYALAAAEYGSSGNASCLSSNSPNSTCTFYDVTQGNMDVVCAGTNNCYGSSGSGTGVVYGILSSSNSSPQPAYPSGNGWDFATGLGTVNAYNLVTNWSGGTSTPPPPTSSATYLGLDTTTEGTWTGVYGGDGFMIANDVTNLPSYASVSISGSSSYTWAEPTSDPRALQTTSGSANRIASAYGGSSFSINVNLSDGNTHRVALYLLDFDNSARADSISILDAATSKMLDTESFSNFPNGEYASWNIKGNVIIQITQVGAYHAVVSGLFFGPAGSAAPPPSTATATYTGLDTTTEGTWTGNYGGDGYLIANDTSSIPAYASVSLSGDSAYTWVDPTSDPRALQISAGATNRIASAYGGSSFTISVNLTDGNTHRVSLYLLDFDNDARADAISILDASSGAVLSNQSFANFTSGEYASWNISGNVIIQVSQAGTSHAVISGIFFGPPGASSGPPPTATATYSGLDTATQGTWTGKYGADGYSIANDANVIPSYASFSLTGDSPYTWAEPVTDPRALQISPGSSTRIASAYGGSSFNINLNLTDGNTHKISLYLLDYDNAARADSISILDAATNKTLDSESFANFTAGEYAVWNIKGNVVIQVTQSGTTHAIVNGIFFN